MRVHMTNNTKGTLDWSLKDSKGNVIGSGSLAAGKGFTNTYNTLQKVNISLKLLTEMVVLDRSMQLLVLQTSIHRTILSVLQKNDQRVQGLRSFVIISSFANTKSQNAYLGKQVGILMQKKTPKGAFYAVINLNTQYIKNNKDRLANLPAIDSFINFISITLTINAKNKGINSTIASLIAKSFIVGLNASKLIMIFTYPSFYLFIFIFIIRFILF